MTKTPQGKKQGPTPLSRNNTALLQRSIFFGVGKERQQPILPVTLTLTPTYVREGEQHEKNSNWAPGWKT
jgi:hypothetical protein